VNGPDPVVGLLQPDVGGGAWEDRRRSYLLRTGHEMPQSEMASFRSLIRILSCLPSGKKCLLRK
jgi:hypothetical protein